ncbi:MAG TPA: S8 family serine peptidase [Coriobacteriia bacterium]|nr:S8 family serine peptidase [Coriobacteriia bacterium]
MISQRTRPTWRTVLFVALALLLPFGPIVTAGAFDPGEAANGTYLSDQILVGFKPGTSARDRANSHASLGTKARGRIAQIDVEIVEVPRGRSVEGLIEMYKRSPNVAFAEPDYIAAVELTPDDPLYPQQWAHEYSNTPAAWHETSGSSNTIIAFLDTGLEITHPDIAGRVVAGYDFVNKDADPSDDHGHGTRVTGLAAATGNNALGVAGVDWGAQIMPVKVMNSSGTGSWSAVASGITYAVDNGADVINMSLGGTPSITLETAVRYAYDKGVTLVAAAGNDGAEIARYPAAYPEVIAVGSVCADRLSAFSNYGSHLAVVAPGEGVYTITLGGGYRASAGTSAASPFVAGLAALLHATKPGISPAEVKAAITSTARDLGDQGWDKYFGYGHIDAAAALAAVESAAPAPEPTTDPGPAPEPEPTTDPAPTPEPEPAPAPVDSLAPVVAITSPADGSKVSGVVAVTASAGDDKGVVRVEFFANGSLVGSVSSAPYSVNWNTRRLSGSHTLTAIAYDAAGNTGVSPGVIVTVGQSTKTAPSAKKK